MNLTMGITALFVFAAAVFATVSLALSWEAIRDAVRRRQVRKRLDPVLSAIPGATDGRSDELIRHFEAKEGTLADLAEVMPGMQRMKALLRESRVDWTPTTVLLLTCGLGFGFGAATVVATGEMIFGFLAAVMGASLPYLYLRRVRANRLSGFEEEFPESIDLLTRAIRAGHPLAAGMRMVADEGPPFVAEEFRQTFEEQRFGLPFADALLGLVDRVNLVDVRIFTIAVLIQREVGGNLAEILDNLAETIRGRFYIRRQLRVYTAQGRMSGYALAALPVVVGTATFMMQPDYIGLLFNTGMGRALVVTALLLQGIGVIWIRNIINIDI